MALNFPSTTGQATDGSFTHTESGVTWAWDGITWKSQAVQAQQSESDPVFLASPAGLISSQDVTEWNTAYGWGDHSLAGYGSGSGGSMGELVDDTTPQLGGILDCNGFSIDFGTNIITDAGVANYNTAYGWGDHSQAGYLTSYTETDPVFAASDAAGVTTAKISNWDTSYSWGDHAAAGYLTSYTPSDTLASVVTRGSSSEGDLTVNGNLYVSDGSGPSSSHRLYNSSDDLIIQNSTGSGRIRASCRSGFEVTGGIYSNTLISVGGNVSLYKDNGTSGSSVKLSTSSDGISIYGGLELTSGDITLENGSKLKIENSPSGTAVYLGHVNASQGEYYDFSQFNNFGNVLTAIHTDGSAFFTNITAAGLTYPTSDGQSGQFLQTDGSGNLSWQSANNGGGGGGTSLGSRQIFSGSTSNSHANNTSENLTIAAYKGYALYKVSVSEPAWVTLYVSSATRTSDISRLITEDPSPGSGILAEAITQSSSETVLFTPALIGYNDDSTPTTNIYLKVVNRSGSTQSINVELTVTQLEV